MKLYISGVENGGDGVYNILTEQGEHLASHYCSNAGYAKGDLESNRPERQKAWKERFGDYQVLWLGDDEMTKEELLKRNKEFGGLKKEEMPSVKIVVEVDGKERTIKLIPSH